MRAIRSSYFGPPYSGKTDVHASRWTLRQTVNLLRLLSSHEEEDGPACVCDGVALCSDMGDRAGRANHKGPIASSCAYGDVD